MMAVVPDVHGQHIVVQLTRLALLNGVALTLISLQFISPPVFVILLLVIPTVFAVGAVRTQLLPVLIAAVAVILLATILYGLINGAWMVLYVSVGLVNGLTRRWRWQWYARMAASSTMVAVALTALFLALLWLAGIDLVALLKTARLTNVGSVFAVLSILVVGFGAIALITGVGVDLFVSRVDRRLRLAT